MKHLLLTTGALLGAVLVLTSAAQAGDRDGRARGVRSRTVRSGQSFRSTRSMPSRSFPSRARVPRGFNPRSRSVRSRSDLFRSRSQLPSRARVPSNVSRFRRDSRSTPSLFSRSRTTSAPQVLYGPGRSSRGSRVNLGNRSTAASAAQAAAYRARMRATVDRLRNRSSAPTTTRSRGVSRSWPRSTVSTRGIRASSRGDTVLRSRNRTFGSRATRFTGSRLGSSRVVTGSRFGSVRRTAGSRTAVAGSADRAVIGGRVRVRPGTRGRVGRSYRISRPHRHYSHLYGYRPWAGFYYSWYPYAAWPYYRIYPRYGLYFGFGISYYGPAYETVFVDATDYVYPEEVVVEEEVVQDAAPAVEVAPPTAPGGFPAPAPAPSEQPSAEGTEAQGAPNPDFQPAVNDFLEGRYQVALQRLDRVTEAEPDNGEAWLAVMHANFALGRYAMAGLALAKAAALDAFPRGYQFDVRPLYAKQPGSYDRFVKALDAHLATHPKDADALLVRAYLYLAMGEKTPARQALDMVLEVRPADETAPRLAMALLPPPPPPAQPAQPGNAR